jgi:hypothetical protein
LKTRTVAKGESKDRNREMSELHAPVYVGIRRAFLGRGCFVDLDVEKTPIEVCRFAQRAFGIGRCWKIPWDYCSPSEWAGGKPDAPKLRIMGLGSLVERLGRLNAAA